MTNLELAMEKLEAARLIIGAAESYLETVNRLIAESSKLADEAEQLLEADNLWKAGMGETDGTDRSANNGQGQRVTPQPSDATQALSASVPRDAS
jgi:hypothetical protein